MNYFKVAAYLRVSKEKEDNNESNSISNQQKIINSYIQENNDLELIDYYIDDGQSGTDFDRPAFKRLLKDTRSKGINTIIVKDLSRFGRNYIDVGNYIENIFPLLNIRFISINDNFDSNECSSNIEDYIPVKNIFNDLYAKDISRKVKSSLKTKKINGEFIGKSAPYGYIKDPDNPHKFIIDESASKIVKMIFDLTLQGKTRKEISEELNKLEITPPGIYLIENNISNYKITEKMKKWNLEMLNRILKNQSYTGDLIQGKVKRANYRIHKLVPVEEDDWIITENHHEPIVSKEIFEKVQHILKNKKRL